LMPRSPHSRNTAAADASARSQAWTLFCWEPTWNEMPRATRSRLWAFQHVRGHGGLAAELAQRYPPAVEDAAEHLRTGRCAGDLLDPGPVDGEELHAKGVPGRRRAPS
jgi:hypothetical protein